MKTLLHAVIFLLSMALPAFASGVGFTRIAVDDPMGGTMQVSLWYPADVSGGTVSLGPFNFPATRDAAVMAGRHGLVVISHGTEGSDLGHRNLAIALARAGFITAAPLHPRNNYRDNSGVGRRIVMEGRPRQIGAVVDALKSDAGWRKHIDASRIGAFGFSLGGYTVLAAAGAKADPSNVIGHCISGPADPFCNIVGPLSASMREAIEREYQEGAIEVSGPRFCAISIADPVAVPFSDDALAKLVTRHVQVWRPEQENTLLAAAHASRVVRQLNLRADTEIVTETVVTGAQHYSFLAPFPAQLQAVLPRQLTEDAPGFDRKAFQARFAAEVTDFFLQHMKSCTGGTK